MKVCGSCGAVLADRARFCTECGTGLGPAGPNAAPEAPRADEVTVPSPETPTTDESTDRSVGPSASQSTSVEPQGVEQLAAGSDATPEDLVGDRDDPPIGPETLPPPTWGVPSGPFEPSSGSSDRLGGSGRPATYAGVLVPPDPGSRPRRIGVTALAVLVLVALAAGAVVLVLAIRGDGKKDESADPVDPVVADIVEDMANLRPSQKTLGVGDQTSVRIKHGFAVVEIEADGPTETLLRAPRAVVVLVPDDPQAGSDGKGGPEPADANRGVTYLASGRNRVLVIAKGSQKKIELSATKVTRKQLPANNLVDVTLTKAAPVLDVAFSPGVDHAWNLVDEGPAGIEAVVYDVTESAESGVGAGEVVCDLQKIACAITAKHKYVLRVSAEKAPVEVNVTLEDQPPTGGPGSVTFDGADASFGGQVAAGKSITYELVVGPPDGVIVTVTPIGIWDPEVKVDGKLVSKEGPVIPEDVRVEAGVRRTFTVGGGQVGGGYVISVDRG